MAETYTRSDKMEKFLEAFLTAITKFELGSLHAGAPVSLLAYCPHQNTCKTTEINSAAS